MITLPYVVRTVYAALSLFDFTLIDAARTLGLSYPKAVLKVLVPSLAPAFLTSGMFAFLASMDNYPISIFFTDAWTKTLPIQMLQYVEESPDPTIAAISALLILLAAAVLVIGDRLVGLRRMAGSLMAAPMSDRDFRGYGDTPPAIRWPNGARLAVSVVSQCRGGRGALDRTRRRAQ